MRMISLQSQCTMTDKITRTTFNCSPSGNLRGKQHGKTSWWMRCTDKALSAMVCGMQKSLWCKDSVSIMAKVSGVMIAAYACSDYGQQSHSDWNEISPWPLAGLHQLESFQLALWRASSTLQGTLKQHDTEAKQCACLRCIWFPCLLFLPGYVSILRLYFSQKFRMRDKLCCIYRKRKILLAIKTEFYRSICDLKIRANDYKQDVTSAPQ